VVLPVIIYLLSVVTISYSTDKSEGVHIAGRQTAILFMPVLLVLNEINLQHYKKILLKIFAVTCVLVIVYLYADAIHTIIYFHLPLTDLFSTAFINHNFSLPISLHATYLSLYVAFSIFIFFYSLIREKAAAKKILYIAGMLILIAGLIQLTSRAVVIGFLLIITIAVPLFLLSGKKRILFSVIALMIAGCTFYFVSRVDAFKTRYISELNNDLTKAAINNERLEPRVTRWNLAADLIRKKPLTGYGTGSEKNLLKEQYFNNKLYISFLNEFNVHSQYLSFMLRSGIFGLLIYLIVLCYAFVQSIRKKDFLFFSFLLLIATVSVSENILDVNKGIFFYSFFLSFFLMTVNNELFYKGNSAAD
jgi:O-antigen ligase